ncbi:MAG: hypothetical protein OHK0031_17870 [Anaerolineales bacterium]
MKYIKIAVRVWIALTSVMSFLMGWAFLAHSPKPIQPQDLRAAPLPALQPLPFENSGNASGGFQLFGPSRVRANSYPMFRSSGS